MDITKCLKYSWAAFDGLMILFILVLMGGILAVPKVRSSTLRTYQDEEELNNGTTLPYTRQLAKHQGSRKAISVVPVAYERGKVTKIARNMVFSESVKLPIRPALDMREKDETCVVRFALPQGTDADGVNVKVTGNILTLFMQSDKRAHMRRIRIPCDYAHNSTLNHFVSNQVLYVELSNNHISDVNR